VESDEDVVVNLLSPNNRAIALHFGNPSTALHGGIIYNHSTALNGMLFRTNGNLTRMIIANNGEVGIGTITPVTKLDVNGSLNVSSEIRRTPTGAANLVPICYGSVSPGSPPVIESGTGNFSVTSTIAGEYHITIDGQAYNNDGYSTVVTPVSSGFRAASSAASSNKLIIRIFNSLFDKVDTQFHFVVYEN
jgi:hypothetical protein